MSLLSQLLKESASGGASSAGGVANNRGSLFGGGKEANGGTTIMLRRMGFVEVGELPTKPKAKKQLFKSLKEDDNSLASAKPFDYQETLAKLDQAVKSAGERKENIAVFGLEDDEGKIVKVYVDKEEASKFEDALAQLLADNDTVFADEDEPKTETEIAEILYKLKDDFNIRDVEWGTIQGDEEEEFDVGGEEGLEGEGEEGLEGEGELGDEDLEGEDLEGEGLEGEGVADEENAMTALQSVIQMMQADSDARKAEALARQSEAEAVIAKNAAAAAQAQVDKQEDLLDMQTAEKAEKAARKEAETLAKLAKYKKEVGGEVELEVDPEDDADAFAAGAGAEDDGGEDFDMEGEENEEKVVVAKPKPQREITKEQLAKLILKYAAANGQK